MRQRFPAVECIELPDVKIRYAKKNVAFQLLLQTPKLVAQIKKDKQAIKKLATDKKPDLIISDGRLGFYERHVHSILINHQLNIFPNKLWGAPARKYLKFRCKQFDELWIPDNQANPLSGVLSKGNHAQKKWIGTLSRFSAQSVDVQTDVLLLLSGPETQRSVFEELLLSQRFPSHWKIKLIRGTNKKRLSLSYEDLEEVIDLAMEKDIEQKLNESKLIICRSGYSTIMDLDVLHKKAIFIPTPGQQEQEYLAKHLQERNSYFLIEQKTLRQNKDLLTNFITTCVNLEA